jgi:phage shock protein PspC (stress-responsive transcriptional regulator)
MVKRLYRSRNERVIWGICGGLGKYFNVDPVLMRVIAVLTLCFGGWGILAYIILRFIIPLEPEEAVS